MTDTTNCNDHHHFTTTKNTKRYAVLTRIPNGIYQKIQPSNVVDTNLSELKHPPQKLELTRSKIILLKKKLSDNKS